MLKKLVVVTTSLVLFLIPILESRANVDSTWDWINRSRTIAVFYDTSITAEWKAWIRLAWQSWNSLDNDWVFVEGPDPRSSTPVTFILKELDCLGYARGAWELGQNIIQSVLIEIDSNPSKPWGRSGDTYDPVFTAMHELGHAIRVAHGVSPDIMRPGLKAGDHRTDFTNHDKQEARDSYTAATETLATPTGGYQILCKGFREEGVGGVVIPVNKLVLLAPYIGLASTITVAAVASAVYIRRVKGKKEKK